MKSETTILGEIREIIADMNKGMKIRDSREGDYFSLDEWVAVVLVETLVGGRDADPVLMKDYKVRKASLAAMREKRQAKSSPAPV